jgi:hypothetical protein
MAKRKAPAPQPVTKVADVTHFRVGLDSLQRHVSVAGVMAAEVRPLPRQVRGLVVNPGGAAAVRVSVQPALPNGGAAIGRGVVTDELGVFTLPIPDVPDEQRKIILAEGLGLRFTGRGNATQHLTVAVPDAGSQALGQLVLGAPLAGETTLGAELELLYTPAAIGGSAFAPVLAWRWDGTSFVGPA